MTEIIVLPFFRKLEFSRVLHGLSLLGLRDQRKKQEFPWEKTQFSHALKLQRVRTSKDYCPHGASMATRVTQGRAERTTCPIVQRSSNPVPKRVKDLEMVRVMDPDHGLEGDPKLGRVGCPSLGLYEDPAWVCVRGPLLATKKMGMLGWGPLVKALTRPGLGPFLFGQRKADQAPRSLCLTKRMRLGTQRMIDCPVNTSRYEIVPLEHSPSTIFSVFCRPLLFAGSSDRGDFGGAVGDMEPLRVISEDGREWGEVLDRELIAVDQETRDVGLQNEELDTVSPDDVGYESWEDNCLGKFSEFLGISTAGYENEILGLVQKMVSQ